MQEPITITISGILNDLQEGYTRTKDDKHYQGEGKSIQEKYNLKKSEIFSLFKHDKLKGRKTISTKAVSFVLIDDTEEEHEQAEDQEVDEAESELANTDLDKELAAKVASPETLTNINEHKEHEILESTEDLTSTEEWSPKY
tara:strand:+ start:11008 stop:11433 length:426 start_codon:yes stop_codon:yes gene_type:complete